MRTLQQFRVAGPFAWAWLLLGLMAAAWVGTLVRYWGTNPAYADRLLIVLASLWAARERWPSVRAVARPMSFSPAAGGPIVLMLCAGLLLVSGWHLYARVGGRTLLLWWLAAGLILASSGMVLAQFGRAGYSRLFFPLVFTFFALPLPDTYAGPLQNRLQQATTSIAELSLSCLGYETERHGFVLQLPSGDLGVAEACSGVRSLTALTAFAAFVAYLRGLGAIRGVTVVILAVPVVVLVNAVRVTASGVILEQFGSRFVTGLWHEALGLTTVVLGFIAIALSTRFLSPSQVEAPSTTADLAEARTPDSHCDNRLGGIMVSMVGLITAASIVAVTDSRPVEVEGYASPFLERVPFELSGWHGEALPIPESVSTMLRFDQGFYRVYRNSLGRELYVWTLYWPSPGVIQGYHHPDICWPVRGFEKTGEWEEPVTPLGGGQLHATARQFRQGHHEQFVLYWTQDGRKVYSAWEDLPDGPLANILWTADWLYPGSGATSAPRLLVLIADPMGTETSRDDARRFASELADEVYRECPWARPADSE